MSDVLTRVNHILRQHWDPIGCGVPEDEYLQYARILVGGGANVHEDVITATLYYWAKYYMCCLVQREKCREVARLVVEALQA